MHGRARCTLGYAVIAILAASAATAGQADTAVKFDLPAQALAESIRAVGSRTDLNVLFDPTLVAALTAPSLKGDLSANQALTRLLTGTDIKYEYLNEKTVVLAPRVRAPHSDSADRGRDHLPVPTASDAPVPANSSAQSDDLDKSFWDRFRMAQTGQKEAAGLSLTTGSDSATKQVLEEVIVTAQKREERLQDVPVPVTVIKGQELVNNNQLRLQDYYTQIPGLAVSLDDYGGAVLSIRGLAAGAGAPTVGVLVDGVPYGSSSSLAQGQQVPDIDPSDLSRVEVLRGPQGTLYGANSLGGLINYVTTDPSVERFSARVQAGLSTVRNGNTLGYNFRASANVPLSDNLALRVNGYTREDPGYIDNPIQHIDGLNKARAYGGGGSLLWQPSDTVSLKLNALIQHTDRDGSPNVDREAGLGDLQQDQLRNTGWYINNSQLYSLTLRAKLGATDLTAISGYGINNFTQSLDFPAYSPYSTQFFQVVGSNIAERPGTRKFTQELRLSSPTDQTFEWMVGAFYNHEDSASSEKVVAVEPSTGMVVGTVLYIPYPSVLTEYAAFADLTVHFTDRFDIQIGGRGSRIKQTYQQSNIGPLADFFFGGPFIGSVQHTKESPFTYLLTPEFKLSSDLMIYARLASGYRPGGPNYNVSSGAPPSYSADKTVNYEFGFKGSFFDRALTVDASVYYIDWKDIQVGVTFSDGTGYTGNAGAAKSQGAELAVEAKPLTGLTVAGWIAWSDAVLTQPLPPGPPGTAVGASGARLPLSGRVSGSLSLKQDVYITDGVVGFAGAALSYVGNQQGAFIASPVRQDLPGYAKTDLQAGATFRDWTVTLFVNNAADRRGVIGGGLGSVNPIAFNYVQPRTVGLNFVRVF